MRGGSRRKAPAAALSLSAFEWDRALLAVLRHSTIPWDEDLILTPLSNDSEQGRRDRLSLLAQFAAHQAFLQFAGIADGNFDPAEWSIARKRGQDVRLVRTGARACHSEHAPPVLTIIQQVAEHLRVELPVLGQSWARADAVYVEAWKELSTAAKADLRWSRAAAAGMIDAPGADGLRLLLHARGTFRCSSPCREAVERVSRLDPSFEPAILRGSSPLQRYSALTALSVDEGDEPNVNAERILSSGKRRLFVVENYDSFDDASRDVVRILCAAGDSPWIIPDGDDVLPESRRFVVAPRLAARHELLRHVRDLEEFVASEHFDAYLSNGVVPPAPSSKLTSLLEPFRSYVSALAFLGRRIDRSIAETYLLQFLYRGGLEDLAQQDVLVVAASTIEFVDEAVRAEAMNLIAPASRPAICRIAAAHASGIDAALLWLQGGEPAKATELLQALSWNDAERTIEVFRLLPPAIISPALASLHGHALADCGRYRDARDAAPHDELVLARAERRMGDYQTALTRLERLGDSFDVLLLRAEILRLIDRNDEACRILERLGDPQDGERAARVAFERSLHGLDASIPSDHYYASRLAFYRALEAGDFDTAARHARDSKERARTTTERIDALLDLVYGQFTAGAWDDARLLALDALSDIEETQGDRAAGGILFTLAFLSADCGLWSQATQRIARLRVYYAGTHDDARLREIDLLSAHLDFCRGSFREAARSASLVLQIPNCHPQIREAAALILDEIDWIGQAPTPMRSNGKSGNIELTRRHQWIRGRVEEPHNLPGIPWLLWRFRRAVGRRDREAVDVMAAELALTFESDAPPADIELRVLRGAAVREYPYQPHDIEISWCHATRNRLGQWSLIGSHQPSDAELQASAAGDWMECSDRERLYLQGSSAWSHEAREAVAALFRIRAEHYRHRRLLDLEHEEGARGVMADRDGMVGHSPAIRDVETLVAKVARRDVPVCILGESGTGKELVARSIHRQSGRRQKQFTPVNCAALPDNLIESELFGHVRGAFTGADRDRAGLIETTDGGTLFLDEIGELPLAAQAKLLRFLQEGEFRRVGDPSTRSADVRIVSATNRRLEEAVEGGRFRDDLYYRIRGIEILLPPLRDRGGDVLLLANHFLAAERARHRAGPLALSHDVEAIFSGWSWPGNVRELQNTIRGAHAVAGDARELDVEHLPERMRRVVPPRRVAGSYQDAVARFKRDLIERSLLQAGGNQNRAATILGMSRQALAYQIRELGILV
jgi:two-component system NtrC family response regulator